MKYKVGDKVRYDGGDWWFYGTVTAVFEHSICPCYRLSVERMEKKSCKFSIMQFEFELEPYIKPEPEQAKKAEVTQKPGDDAQNSKISDAWHKNLELYRKGEKSGSIYNWVSINRKLYKSGELPNNKLEKLLEIDFPFVVDRKKPEKVKATPKPKKERQKRKRSEIWDKNFEIYRNGEKSNAISSWIAQNRKDYKTGTLPERKLDKLMEINFPFETTSPKKNDNWHQRLEEWKKGERRSTLVQQWRQRSIKKYLEGKLEIDKVAELKKIGILK